MEKIRQRKWLIWLLSVLAAGFLITNICTGFFLDLFLFHPTHLKTSHAFVFPFPTQEFNLETEKGVSINCLLFPSLEDTSYGVVLYFHGNADNMQRWGNYTVDFTHRGYDVLMMDYRGFGKSSGEIQTEEDLFFDAKKLYEYAADRYDATDIILYGRSLGTGIASWLASQVSHQRLILETPYYSLSSLVDGYVPLLSKALYLEYDLRPDLYIQEVRTPIHIFHGTLDEVVPYSEGIKFKEALGERVEFVTILGGRHKDLREFGEYQEGLGRVLKKSKNNEQEIKN